MRSFISGPIKVPNLTDDPEYVRLKNELLKGAHCLYIEAAEPAADDIKRRIDQLIAYIEQ